MSMYAKLMSRITESSLMDEEIVVRYAFMMMLAIADPQGYVVGTDVAIARRMNIPLDTFKKCLVSLMVPDENSNSKEHEGRRVIDSDCERGYYLVNYRKYRDTRDEEHRREYMREYMRNRRNGKDVTPVNNGKQCKPRLAKEEGEVKEEVKTPRKQYFNPLEIELPEKLNTDSFREAWADFVQHRQELKKPLTEIAAKKSINQMEKWGLTASLLSIDKSVRNGYQGLFAPDKREIAQEPLKAADHPALKPTLDPEGWRDWCEAKGYPYMEYAFGRGYMKDEFNSEKRR